MENQSSDSEEKFVFYDHLNPIYNRKGTPEKDNLLLKIVERFLRTGEIPNYHPEIGKMEKEINYAKTDLDYYELMYPLVDLDCSSVMRMPKIRCIKKDLDLEELESFEHTAKKRKWDDKQMGLIFYATVCDIKYSDQLDYTSYKKLKSQLINIANQKYDSV